MQIIAALSLAFEDPATAPKIEACALRLEKALPERVPELVTIFIKPQTPTTWHERRAALED